MTDKFLCLLVSPRPDDRDLLADALRPGFPQLHIRQETTVQGWQKALEASHFALGIINGSLPLADHALLLQAFKHHCPKSPVIILADSESEEAALAELASGFDDYVLRTPEELRLLPRVVNAACRRARQKSDQALRESEVRYRLLVETMNDGLGMMNEKEMFTFVNSRFSEMLGYAKEEILNRPVADFLDAANRKIVAEQIELRKEGARQPYELIWTRKDGTTLPTSISPVPLFDAAGGFKGSFAVVADLTARRQAEQALKESEEKYRAIFENTGTAMGIVDEDNTISLVNAEFAKLAGYSREELEGKRCWMEFAAAADLPKMQEYHRLRRIDPQLPPRSYETQFINRFGEAKDILFTVDIIPGTRQSVGSMLDISARKKSEKSLQFERERFQTLIENSMFHLRIIEPDGTIRYESPTLERLLGYETSEQEGLNAFDFVHPDDQALAREKIAELLANPGTVLTAEMRYRHKDGTWRWLDIKGKNLLHEPIINGIVLNGQDITARKQAEEALRESEKFYASILDTVPDIVYELSLDGHLLYANQATAEILGYAPEELRRLTLADLVDADGLERASRVIAEMVESRQPSSTVSYLLRSAQGRLVPIETHAILAERSNRPTTIVGAARDITARLKAEQALRRAELEKTLILENMSEMVTYRDRDNRILWANPAAAAYLGLTPEEMVGRFCYEIFHQRSTPCPGCEIVAANNAGVALETEVIRGDGRIIFIRSSPVKDEKGEPQGNVVVASDFTGRKKAEEALKASEEKMRLVIESSPVGVYIIQGGRILYANPALVGMFGYGHAAELEGRPATILFPKEKTGRKRRKKAGTAALSSFEARGGKKDGPPLEAQVWQTEIDYQGKPALLHFVLDVSEAKTLRSQLLQSQKMEAIGTLAGGIAHDFNNLLFPILVNTEMVLESLPLDSPSRQRLERVLKACERARDLVKQILTFSRHEEEELSPVRLVPVLEDTLRLLRASLPSTIEMRSHLEVAGDTVLADPTQIQQVVINLYTNAAHAIGDRGGLIEISLTEVEAGAAGLALPPDLAPVPYLQLTVKDNGQGMDPAHLERIFDPYFTTKKTGEGTGLGLTVVHGIIKRHRGAITVESKPGKGSSFHVFLPREDTEILKESRHSQAFPQGQGRVLVVDDEPEIVAALQHMLAQLGYRVTACTDSMEALELFKAHPEDFHVVITDQTMPHLTGKYLTREILALRPEIPVILCTGFSESVSREEAQGLGIREFLIKPFSARKLAETIQGVLNSTNNRN